MEINNNHKKDVGELSPPKRFLFGPGPSNAHPKVLRALSMPQTGHLDPYFINLMQEVQELLRYCWQTDNKLTIPVSGTGSAAMEACVANTVEPGEKMLVAINGYFGKRLVEMGKRYRAEVVSINKPWGEVFTLDEIKEAIEKHKPKVFGIVHAETSTGALQPLEGIGELCHKNDCLFLVDTVTSFCGAPLFLDKWGIDACYSGSQKNLACPPGIAPLSFSPRAFKKLQNRKSSVGSWYLDLSLIANYWGPNRTYHHTAPINLNYALREALKLVSNEGLQNVWKRHKENAEKLWDGLEALGLKLHVAKEHRIPSLTTVRVPEGVDAKAVTKYLLQNFNIEIGNGLGELGGKVWRIGLMGYNSTTTNVLLLISAIKEALRANGYDVKCTYKL